MVQKDEINSEKLEHSGIFDFLGFYRYAHSWLKDEGYGVTENKYSEKVSSDARDISIEWTATKEISDYFKFEIKIKIEISGLTNVKAQIDKEKRDMNKGKVTISTTGNLIKDPESKWDTSPFYRFLRDFYNKYIIPARVEDMEGRVSEDVSIFKEELKAFLELSGKR